MYVHVKKRGVCNERIHTRNNLVIKPILITEIHDGHNHGSDPARIEMLKGYNYVKQRSINSEESTRNILHCPTNLGNLCFLIIWMLFLCI